MGQTRTNLEAAQEIKIPFQGFYNTAHDGVFDMALEQINTDDSNEIRVVISEDNVEWEAVRLGYAQKYLSKVNKIMGIETEFSGVQGQKDYANGNDTLLAKIDRSALHEMHKAIISDPERNLAWEAFVKDALTERPGFIPYYSAQVKDWGPFEGWDDAQIDCMLSFRGAELEIDETEIALELLDYVDEKIWSSVIDPDKVPGHVDNTTEEQPSL